MKLEVNLNELLLIKWSLDNYKSSINYFIQNNKGDTEKLENDKKRLEKVVKLINKLDGEDE